jgi:hypothetical protein
VAGGSGEGTHAFWGQYVGAFGNRTANTLGQITVQDGTSNTLMFGETLGGNGVGIRDHMRSWIAGTMLATYRGLVRNGAPATTDHPGGPVFKFSSRHAAGVQFCFGDCSTRQVRFTSGLTSSNPAPDWWILQQLAGRKDGRNDDTSSILD